MTGMTSMRGRSIAAWLLLLVSGCSLADALVAPAHGVIGVRPEHLSAQFWIDARPDAAIVSLAPQAVERLNAELERIDPTIHDLRALPATLTRDAVSQWVTPLSQPPTRALYDERGKALSRSTLRKVIGNAALRRIPATQPLRTGLVVQRADLRTFPTTLRVFSSPDDHDIDRFQESALFPGTPVAVLHESRDRDWWFVVSPRYAAWIEKRHVALGAAEVVLGYGEKSPYLVVTGASVETVYTPERPAVSQLRLDMGVRVPLLADWPAERAVNGQSAYASHVIELPQRDADGALELVPALLPATADVARDYLPFSAANVLRQGFKFLGERYGWGHSYDARDCSGFVSEVYRSLGLQLPRNTRDQAVSEAFDRIAFDADDSREKRLAVVRTLDVGDLVYIPGHVMMVIGRDGDDTYVIHDTTGISYLDDGELRRVPLNSVAVTPLEPLMADAEHSYVDRITSIQRLRPHAPPAVRIH
jgi:cell wall-associated NlpC family hydrolase